MKSKILKSVYQKRILVTGGTGSFGKLFVTKLLSLNPKEVIVFSRDEDKQGQMKQVLPDKRLRYIIGDVRDIRSVQEATRGVDIIVHAAALKWIPEVEQNVWEGIKTNVIGIQNIIEAARNSKVQKVVALSTDKAVEPINAYGMTKALQERLVTTANLHPFPGNPIFISTRYGNVLGSRGSVVPLFKSQIDNKQPITITDPKMTRFLLTLDGSVELVLHALSEGVGGEIFVKKMPAHSISDLVEVIQEQIPLNQRNQKIIGIRPGEKLHEALLSNAESARTIESGDYYIILPQINIPTINKKYSNKPRMEEFYFSSDTTKQLNKDELKSILKKEGWL